MRCESREVAHSMFSVSISVFVSVHRRLFVFVSTPDRMQNLCSAVKYAALFLSKIKFTSFCLKIIVRCENILK